MKIEIVQNGDIHGVETTLPMEAWHELLKAELAKVYPTAKISIYGRKNVDGGNSSLLFHVEEDEDDGFDIEVETDISDEVNQIFASDIVQLDDRWQ